MAPMTSSQEMEADSVHKEGGKKEQAQENSNRFNSIRVSFSYLRILFFFFNLMGKKKGGLSEYHPQLFHPCILSFTLCLSWEKITWVAAAIIYLF